MNERTVILHYHLFKNAGTSFDKMLQANFPGAWVTREFATADNSRDVAQWIIDTPEAVAFSSHSANGPIPVIDGIRIISVLFLRDPIQRIISAYNFERLQTSESLGTKLAREHDLEGYVRARLAIEGDRQCRNFHVRRLASFVPSAESELERAKQALGVLSFIGKVEDYKASVDRFAALLAPTFPQVEAHYLHSNRTATATAEVAPHVIELLSETNRDDLELLKTFELACMPSA